jgi:CheY-like chemotaxis protein
MPLSGKHVLVVDDHEDTLEIADTMLSHAGAVVITVAALDLAVTMLSERTFDVVVTDLGFGGEAMAGLRVLDAARQPSPRCKVIAVTGRKDAAPDDLKGFDLVIMKPVDPFDLVAAVVRVMALAPRSRVEC